MKTDKRFLLTVALFAAMALTFSACTDEIKDLLDGASSSSNDGTSSPSGGNQSSSSGGGTGGTNSSSSYIEITDPDIEPAASFASEFFNYISFPFIGIYDWISIDEDAYYSLDWFVDERDNDNGEAFKSIFKRLYNNREEYLSNGKFQRYIELIANLIPREKYVANGWDAMARQLLIAYEDLKASPGSFSQVYEIMMSPIIYHYSSVDYYDEILPFVSENQLEAFITPGDFGYLEAGEINKWAVVWAYSFWGRRYNENPGSVEPIAAILRLLRDDLFR